MEKMLNLQPYRQKPGQCGPASLKIVLEYYGISASESELATLCKTNPKKGTTAQNIVQAARELGFSAAIKDFSEIRDIRKQLKKRIPVIVDWFSVDDGHYSVVQGISRNTIWLSDPELGKTRKMNLKTFERVWFDFSGESLREKKQLIIRRMICIRPTKKN